MMAKESPKRTAVLDCAHRLFESSGFNAVGVDQIATESGVTKRTLYKHFGSKENLIKAVLEDHHNQMMASMRERVDHSTCSGEAQLLKCFELYREWFGQPTFYGCIFIKTVNEFATCSSSLSQLAQQAKSAIRKYLYELASQANAKNPDLLADQLQLLLEGSIVVAQLGTSHDVIDTAKTIAEKLIQEQLPSN